MEYTAAERLAAARDAFALIRYVHEGDITARDAILGLTDDKGRRATAEALASGAYDAILCIVVASGTVGLDNEQLERIISADRADLAALPGVRESVTAYLAAIMAELAGDADDSGMG